MANRGRGYTGSGPDGTPRYGGGLGGRSEYGGGDGTVQRYPDGSPLPLEDLASSSRVSDRARLLRQAGMADYDPSNLSSDRFAAEAEAARAAGLGRADAAGIGGGVISHAAQMAFEEALARANAAADEETRLRQRSAGYVDLPETYVGEDGATGGVEGLK